MVRLYTLILAFVLISGASAQDNLKEFTSDGCSLFPDRDIILKKDWCECCFEHDIAYWKGGTEAERLLADTALKNCVLEKTGNNLLSETIFKGVRFGGSPYFYNWYRWGYGWPYKRKYKPLSHEEEAVARKKLEAFFDEHGSSICK